MPVTVATLLGHPALGLTLHTRSAPVDRRLSWVHVSELADPAPFLEGGELLLTTGLPLTPDGDRCLEYVDRLAGAGVAALGLGTGLSHPHVPRELVRAADERGLAVLEVPRRTPFIALSRTVSAALAADEYAAVAKAAAVQQELTRATLGTGAPAAVVERLARHLGGWALLVDAAGTPLQAAPRSALQRAGDLVPAIDRLRAARPPAGAALTRPEDVVLLQSLGTGARARGFLAVGRRGPFPAADRSVVNAAALLLTLRLEQSRALDGATALLRAALLRLLLEGQDALVGSVLGELGERLPDAPVRPLVVLGGADQRAAAVDSAGDAAAHAGETLFAADLDGALVILVAGGGKLADRSTGLTGGVAGAVLGTAEPVPWPRLADGVRQARQAAEHGRAGGHAATAFADLAGRGLGALLDPAATSAFAEATLAPLVAADRAGPGDLVDSLRIWLSCHGQWEPAAARLGVHRHTMRKRIRRAAELLGRDLDDPAVRAELWLALHPPTA
ncbi:purine catabolism regulatory protein [Blastococcus sp. DSM 46786]|uniref:PucR family transcriptional regulator n=1 Tax=Blastococcus sp. DSM 46786 TaxID=1798227 RepID=UPI0008D59D48|nr:PucR family transcriptional regulator [Blastococcus sp. DSM 46786]SEL41823.1 purine catabolism regulatory protein [Blastococcus sp. DSM 46786]